MVGLLEKGIQAELDGRAAGGAVAVDIEGEAEARGRLRRSRAASAVPVRSFDRWGAAGSRVAVFPGSSRVAPGGIGRGAAAVVGHEQFLG
jgi:hypothetical protein